MNIKTLMNNVYFFIDSMRISGTTTLIQKIASENDVWVLVPDSTQKHAFGEKAITFDEISRMGARDKKPILFDNYTLLRLSESVIREFTTLESMIAERDKLIKTIRDEIALFDRNRLG